MHTRIAGVSHGKDRVNESEAPAMGRGLTVDDRNHTGFQ